MAKDYLLNLLRRVYVNEISAAEEFMPDKIEVNLPELN
jgi:hypothetical protein